MDEMTKRKLALLVILMLPIMAWIGTAKKTGQIEAGHFFIGIAHAASATPSSLPLIAAPVVALGMAILLVVLLFKFSKREFAGANFSRFLRGAKLTSPDALSKKTREKKAVQIDVAGVPMPTNVENRHMLVGGSTSTGKSVLFRRMLYSSVKRRDRNIVLDPNGDMMTKFFMPGDTILNPYDNRTEGWSVFNEVRSDFDFKRLTLSIVPRGQTAEAEEWAGYGRLLLTEVIRQLYKQGTPTMQEVFQWTNIEPEDKLRKFLQGTMAEALFVGSENAVGSARFILSDKLPEHVTMPAGAFSLKAWLEDPAGGNLWITWREDMAEALRPLISSWIDILCTGILSMPPDENRRLWMFLDELASLEKLAGLEPALTKGRKHGLRVVAGLQSTAQLDVIYGRTEAQVLRACFRSLAVLGGAKTDHTTAEDLSASLGEHEVEREQKSTNGGMNGGTSISYRHERERVVMPSEITHLPDLTGYLSFSGDLPIARFKLQIQQFKDRIPAFVERDLINA